MQAECAKATKILEHLIKPRNQIDTILIPSKIIQQAKGIAVLTVLKGFFKLYLRVNPNFQLGSYGLEEPGLDWL